MSTLLFVAEWFLCCLDRPRFTFLSTCPGGGLFPAGAGQSDQAHPAQSAWVCFISVSGMTGLCGRVFLFHLKMFYHCV